MAEINFLKSFSGSERQFAESFQGINYVHNAPAQLYLTGYSKAYEKTYTGVYVKQYTAEYQKQYSKEYEGTYNKQYEGSFDKQYEGTFNKQYEGTYTGQYTKTYVGLYEGSFEGTFNKQYEGSFTKQYSGQFTGNQEYNGNTFGQFEGVFGESYTGLFAESGTPYIKTYIGQYTKEYSGQYEGQFTKQYSGVYEGSFNKTYVGQYQSTYNRNFVASWSSVVETQRISNQLYSGTYEKIWTHVWQGSYTKTYHGQYTKQYQGSWTKTYTGQYTQTYLGSYTKTYVGQYTKGYVKHYTKTYLKQYQKEYTHNYAGLYTKTYIGQFVKNWVPTPPGDAYIGTYVSNTGYVSALPQAFIQGNENNIEDWNTFIGYYDQTFTPSYEGVFVPSWMGGMGGMTPYIRAGTDWQRYVSQDAGIEQFGVANFIPDGVPPMSPGALGYQGSGTAVGYGNTYAHNYLNTQTGQSYVRNYISSYKGGSFIGPMSWGKTYTDPNAYASEQGMPGGQTEYVGVGFYSMPGGPPVAEMKIKFFLGPNPVIYYRGQYVKQYAVGPYLKTYEGSFDFQYAGNTIVTYLKQFTKEYHKQYSHTWTHQWEGFFNKQYEGGFDKQYEGFFNKTYTGVWAKQYEGFFNKTYIGNYEKTYIAQYEGTRSSTRTFIGSYVGFFDGISYEGYFNGPVYLGNYTKTYTGLYEGQFSKQYSGVYEGTFTKQYEGAFTRNYIKQWSGTYIKGYSGVYQGGPYNTQYTGAYAKTYLGLYTKEYSGQYSRQFEGAFNKQYEGTFTGQYTKTYTGQYTKSYLGQYTKTYTGIYIKQYTDGYIKHFSKEYEGTFTKQYVKTYGAAWSGAGPAYTGLAYFTNTYLGDRTFHQTYVGTTDEISAASGNMTNNARVKVDGAWKSISRIRVKEDGQWKLVQVSRIKRPDGTWGTVAIDHERVTINVTSNTANFNLGTELTNLGLSLYDKPKHVNINIANNTFIYSSNTTPALDTSLLTGSQGALHKVKILLGTGGGIIGKGGARGEALHASITPSSSQNGEDGGDAILLRDGVSLFIESYGTIAGGGGGGGAGGILSDAYIEAIPLSFGGQGAGWHPSLGYVTESSSSRNGTASSLKYITHGGDGGLLGQLGIAAGGFNADDSSNNEANPGTNYAQYAGSGNGGLPGSAIKGYDASRVTFINSTESSVWGDSAFKFKA